MMRLLVLIFSLALAPTLLAQEGPWSLEDCIQYAIDNNITIQQAELNIQSNAAQLKTDQFGRLPNLNASTGFFLNWGRFVDPTTNDFITENTNATSVNLNSSVPLFNAGRINNTIKQTKANLNASEQAQDNAELNVALSIVQAYLNVLLAKESLQVAEEQLTINQNQVEIAEKQVRAGNLPEGNLLEAKAQLAQAEFQQVDAANQVDLALLTLQLSMLLEPNPEFDIQPLAEEIDETAIAAYESPEALYQQALSTHPSIQQAEYQLKAAELGVDVARSNYYPSLTLSGGVGTTSSSARKNLETVMSGVDTVAFVAGTGESVVAPSFDFEENPYPFVDQWQDNFNRQVGLSLQIPIFNRNQVKNSVDQSVINVQAAELQRQERMNQLRQNIYTAYRNAEANAKRYAAAQNNLDATQLAFEYTQKRYEQGVVTPFDFNIAQNNLNIAQANLLQAKYQYLLSLKVLDYNIGKSIN